MLQPKTEIEKNITRFLAALDSSLTYGMETQYQPADPLVAPFAYVSLTMPQEMGGVVAAPVGNALNAGRETTLREMLRLLSYNKPAPVGFYSHADDGKLIIEDRSETRAALAHWAQQLELADEFTSRRRDPLPLHIIQPEPRGQGRLLKLGEKTLDDGGPVDVYCANPLTASVVQGMLAKQLVYSEGVEMPDVGNNPRQQAAELLRQQFLPELVKRDGVLLRVHTGPVALRSALAGVMEESMNLRLNYMTRLTVNEQAGGLQTL